MAAPDGVRDRSFGADAGLTPIDRFGVWLSSVAIRRAVTTFDGKRIGDFGCGYEASLARTLLGRIDSAVLVDVSLADDLKNHPRVVAIQGALPSALARIGTESLDIVMCISVLEHVAEPLELLVQCRRILAPGGTLLVNVPTWFGKRLLEFSAFRLGLSPREEMDDHKMYYDPRDLWPLLRKAGFLPHNIDCRRHKGGLNTFAVCRVGAS